MNDVMILIMLVLLGSSFACAEDRVEGPKNCQQCGMDRAVFARSRMLVVYADGTSVGLCSLHCAAAELHHNKGKQSSSIMVADYQTKELVDARKAVWVVGGSKQGVMTAVAKWAFATSDGARRFLEVNGGVVSSFDQALNSATQEVLEQAAEEEAVESELLRELH